MNSEEVNKRNPHIFTMVSYMYFLSFVIFSSAENEEQSKAEEDDIKEQTDDNQEEDVSDDEGVEGLDSEESEDQIDNMNADHAFLGSEEGVKAEVSPALEDVMMSSSHLHLPGYEEVEGLALLLLELADDSNAHIIPAHLRQKITKAAGQLHEHDKSARNFVKRYESKWGYTIFGRCLGAGSANQCSTEDQVWLDEICPGSPHK